MQNTLTLATSLFMSICVQICPTSCEALDSALLPRTCRPARTRCDLHSPALNMSCTMQCGALQDLQCSGAEICYKSLDECCVTNDGAVAGVVITCIVVFVASITACAFCCKCFCFRPKPQVVTVTGMQLPTIVQQPVTAGVPVQPATGKFCGKCGNGLDAQAGFCAGCGTKQ